MLEGEVGMPPEVLRVECLWLPKGFEVCPNSFCFPLLFFLSFTLCLSLCLILNNLGDYLTFSQLFKVVVFF